MHEDADATRVSTASGAAPEAGRAVNDAADWTALRRAAECADALENRGDVVAFALSEAGTLTPVSGADPTALLAWHQGAGWESLLAASDPRRAIFDLYLPVCSATATRPITIGHLGQSLDGFIAMHSGESCWVTGPENVRHMHCLRALCDAVVVGAGTVASDDPQLTTRHVVGPNPLRVVLDPARRLAAGQRIFQDPSAETLCVCARDLVRQDDDRIGLATLVGLETDPAGVHLPSLLTMLRARGCRRIFIEGGGVTVSRFVDAQLLDRLQITVAPLLIGDGRPAIRLPASAALADCRRPPHRVFRMGDDLLFDLDLRPQTASRAGNDEVSPPRPISRVI